MGAGRVEYRSDRATSALALLCVVLLAICLRPAATSLGVVLAEVQGAFDLHGWQVGLLTSLPGLAFVVFGALSITVLRRLGLFGTLTLCAVLIGGGIVLRALSGQWWAFAGFTVVALAGMAIGNVILPVFVKMRFPTRQALGATALTVSLGLGSAIPALLTAPVAQQIGGWRGGLGVWAVFPLMALGAWTTLRVLRSIPTVPTRPRGARASGPRIARSRGAWVLAAYFGLQSLHAYVQFGWLPQIYRDAGLDPVTAGTMATIMAAGAIPGGLIAPQIVMRRLLVRTVLAGYAVASMLGYLGLLISPTTVPWLWALCFALGGFSFPSSLALITARTRSPEITARASGFIQSVGYVGAAAGPLLVGSLVGWTGSWTVPLIVLLASAAVLGVVALYAASPTLVDDELDSIPAPVSA